MVRTQPTRRARAGKPIRRPAPSSPSRRRVWAPAASLLTAFVLGIATAFVIGASMPGSDATERGIAELQRAEVERDIKLIGPLTELARGSSERLAPVLQGMAEAAPPGESSLGPVPTAEVVAGWRKVVAEEVARHAASPSAGNAVNIARTGLRTAVQQLAAAVDGFETAVTAAEPATDKLLALAGQQRTLAIRTWSVAAIQLDLINIEAGNGHVHVQLSARPDIGALTPDSSPEGSGR
jgi:hypothetical protein